MHYAMIYFLIFFFLNLGKIVEVFFWQLFKVCTTYNFKISTNNLFLNQNWDRLIRICCTIWFYNRLCLFKVVEAAKYYAEKSSNVIKIWWEIWQFLQFILKMASFGTRIVDGAQGREKNGNGFAIPILKGKGILQILTCDDGLGPIIYIFDGRSLSRHKQRFFV